MAGSFSQRVTCPACGRTCWPKDLNLDDAGNPVPESNCVTYGAFIKTKHVPGGKGTLHWTTEPMPRHVLQGVRTQLARALVYVDKLLGYA